jgi:predicted Zn-dependent protease
MIASSWLIGKGAGNWQVFFPNETLSGIWRAEDLNVTFQRPHNDLLWIMSETGLIGITLFLVFLFSILLRSLSSSQPSLRLAAGFIAGFMVCSFCDFPRERIEHVLLFNMLLAFCYYELTNSGEESRLLFTKKRVSASLLLTFVSAFLCVIAFYRHEGEVYTRDLFSEMNRNNADGVIASGEKAQSIFYSLDPFSVPVNWHIGNALAAQQDYQKAAIQFKIALEKAPFNRHVLNDLGSACAMNGDTLQAKNYYEEAMRISPRFDDPKLNLAAIYIKSGNYLMARKYLNALTHGSDRRREYEMMIEAMSSAEKSE